MLLVPDFHTSSGPKKLSRDLFDISVYNSDDSTNRFHEMIAGLSAHIIHAKPTKFHDFLDGLACSGRLLRQYTQNIDCLESKLPSLSPNASLEVKGPWAKTIQLHGRLDTVVCQKCNYCSPLVPQEFQGSQLPPCPQCEDIETQRAELGKRLRGAGRLRPKILLYGEDNPDELAVEAVFKHDLRERPDAVIVVGTSLKVPGARMLAMEFCRVAKVGRRPGITLWINKERPSLPSGIDHLFDYVVCGDCDEITSLLSA
jgi:NAD-dependent histone deacetylase SIR2